MNLPGMCRPDGGSESAGIAGAAGAAVDSLSVSFLHPKEVTPTSDQDLTE